MKTVGYYNGKMDELEAMQIPMNDRGMYFGDGVYDATYAVNRKIFALDDHIDRFFNSFQFLEIPFQYSKEELAAELQKCVDTIDTDGTVFVYWQTTRGTGIRNHVFPEGKPNLLIYIIESEMKDLFTPFRLISMEDVRFLLCNIKTLNLIPSCIANQRAKEAGCNEAVLHRGERVTECAHSNINILKNGVFITPPTDNLILPGITRKHLLMICEEKGIPTEIRPFTLTELFDCDEAIVSSSGALCVPVSEIDGKPVGGKDKETLLKLQMGYIRKFEKEVGATVYKRP